jgi:hypothetical protein
MARIVNLDELVGEDIEFKYAGESYVIPGDIDVETVFDLFEKFQSVSKIEEKDPAQLTAAVRARFDGITSKLMEVLTVRQPGLERYPFGIRGTGVVLREILSALGVSVTADPPAPAPRAQRRSAGKKRTAARRKG